MPYVNIKLTGGAESPTAAQKAELIQGVTQLLQRVLGKNPETTVVIIDEIPMENWGIGGQAVSELRKNAKNSPLVVNTEKGKSMLTKQAKAILFGVAVGDALGVPVEFQHRQELKANPVTDMRGYGTYHQPKGTWSDDSSMTFCLAESLIKGYDLEDIARTSMNWLVERNWTPYGEVFDIGILTRQALLRIYQGISPLESGGRAETDNGNGALMRILPLVFELRDKDLTERFKIICEVAGFTHAHIRSQFACLYYLEFASQLLAGRNKVNVYQMLKFDMREFIRELGFDDEIKHFKRLLSDDIWQFTEAEIQSSGYVIHTLEAAIWCLLTTDNYQEAVLKAVNLGEDTDTTAAVVGGLAALAYGFDSIPMQWVEQLARKEDIANLAERLAQRYINKN